MERRAKDPRRQASGRKAAETRRERDEFALQNIPDDLQPLWQRTKTLFKGVPDRRSEQFLEYAEQNPQEAIECLQASADAKLEAMIREYEQRKEAA